MFRSLGCLRNRELTSTCAFLVILGRNWEGTLRRALALAHALRLASRGQLLPGIAPCFFLSPSSFLSPGEWRPTGYRGIGCRLEARHLRWWSHRYWGGCISPDHWDGRRVDGKIPALRRNRHSKGNQYQ